MHDALSTGTDATQLPQPVEVGDFSGGYQIPHQTEFFARKKVIIVSL